MNLFYTFVLIFVRMAMTFKTFHRSTKFVLTVSRGLSGQASGNTDTPKNSYNENNAPLISWYPGHIAKAERELADYLKKVDVVIEVRDARIPLSTTHPMVPEWVGNRPLIVAIARLDQISEKALEQWKQYYVMNPAHKDRPETKVYFIDGKMGSGVLTLRKQVLKAGVTANERRVRKGIAPRATRCAGDALLSILSCLERTELSQINALMRPSCHHIITLT